jgi:hypothetical protein
MWVIAAVVAAFLLAFALRAAGLHVVLAWIASWLVVPAYVFFAEYVLPGHAGGAPMWPIAMFVGSIYGAAAGGVGALFASLIWKGRAKPDA